MGGHGYGGAGDASSGFHGGHFVHMRGLPFRATENDIANVSIVENISSWNKRWKVSHLESDATVLKYQEVSE